MDRNCSTCKHYQVLTDREPCVSCDLTDLNTSKHDVKYTNWEPKEMDKSCTSCKHSYLHGNIEPCVSCDVTHDVSVVTYTNWEPKTMTTPKKSTTTNKTKTMTTEKATTTNEPSPKELTQVLLDRGEAYGTFKCNAETTQTIYRILTECHDHKLTSAQREAIHMICHKLSRIVCGDPGHKDSWVDIAGYATLMADMLD